MEEISEIEKFLIEHVFTSVEDDEVGTEAATMKDGDQHKDIIIETSSESGEAYVFKTY